MATYYCRPDATSDANAGTGANTTQAVQNPITAINKATAGDDNVIIAPGTYRYVGTITKQGTSGHPINVIGDIFGASFAASDVPIAAGDVILSAYTTDDLTAPNTSQGVLNLGGKSDLSFSRLTIVGSGATGGGCCIQAGTSHSRRITITDCAFIAPGGALTYAVWYTGSANVQANWLIERCLIYNMTGVGVRVDAADPGSSGADLDMDFTIRNCEIIALPSYGVRGVVAATSTGGFKAGGLRVQNCTIVSGTNAVATTGSSDNWSHTFPLDVKDSLLVGSNTMNAQTSGQITESGNVVFGSTPRSNVTAGTGSRTGNVTAPLMHFGQEVLFGRPARPFMSPTRGSPLLAFGAPQGSPPAVDLFGVPRALVAPYGAVGAMERANAGGMGGSANADGGTGDCYLITGFGSHDLEVAVDPVPTTITIKQKTASYVGTNYPRVSLLANTEIGVAAQDVDDTAANTAYTTLTVGPFTPSGYGAVVLRLQNRTGDTAGQVFWDTGGIT